MVIVSNIIFTITEIVMLGYLFKELKDISEIMGATRSSLKLDPVNPLITLNESSMNINQNLCSLINFGNPGDTVYSPPTQVLYVPWTWMYNGSRTITFGCYQYTSLCRKDGKLFTKN